MERYFKMLLSLMASIILLVTFYHTADAFEIGARAYYWFPTLRTDAKVDGASVKGTEVDLKDDLGVGHEYYPSLEVYAGYKIIKLYVNEDDVYLDSEFTGPFVALTVGF